MNTTGRFRQLYIAEIIAIAAVAVWMASSQSLWADEAFSIALVRRSVPQIISFTASDVHPPLYYLLLKCAVAIFGEHWIVLRMVSVIPFILMLLAAGQLLRREFATWSACLGVFLLAAAPGILRYAVEIRMYSWAYLWVLLSFIISWHLMAEERPHWKWWAALALTDAAAAYTHYFAGAAVLVIAMALLVVRLHRFKSMRGRTTGVWILVMAVTALLYLPWLFVFMRQAAAVSEDYWIEPIDGDTLLGYCDMVIGHRSVLQQVILTAVVIASVCCLIWPVTHQRGRMARRRQQMILLGYLIFFGYILLGVLLSVLIRPVFFKRYIIIVLPLFWIAAAGSLALVLGSRDLASAVSDSDGGKRVVAETAPEANRQACIARGIKESGGHRMAYNIFLCILLCAVAVSGAISLREEVNLRRSPANDTAYLYLKENLAGGDAIYTNSIYTLEDLNVYFPEYARYLPAKTLDIEKFKRWDEMADVRIVENAKACIEEVSDSSDGVPDEGVQDDAAGAAGKDDSQETGWKATNDTNQNPVLWIVTYKDKDDTVQRLEEEGYAVEDCGTYTMGFTGWDRDHIRVKIYKLAL